MRGVDELNFPDDLAAWHRWESRRRRPQRASARLRQAAAVATGRSRSPARIAHLLLPEEEPDVLVVLDGWSPSYRLAIAEPLRHLNPRRTAVLTDHPDAALAHGAGRHAVAFDGVDRIPASVRQVLTLGAYLDLAARVEPWARRRDARFVVVQHGLLTPWAPPLTRGAHLLAWSDEDASYWTAGRSDITWRAVGSQLLWNASTGSPTALRSERPVMLGQLHGTELPALAKQRLYTRFCRAADADYRPHPNEVDRLSRLHHKVMAASGVRFDRSSGSVPDLARPVVSIFSTGTLEAAQRGLPAFVYHPDPPPWLRAFWKRHRLASFGGSPTQPWPQPDLEPARAVAEAVSS